ncbi:hypothetical protein D3C72_2180450 [compost metagenome]
MHDLSRQAGDKVVAQFVGQAGIQPVGNPATLRPAGKVLYRCAQAEIDIRAALG